MSKHRTLRCSAVLWLLLTSGCIYLPNHPQAIKANEPIIPDLVGRAGYRIHEGSSESEVLTLLGKPYAETKDRRDLAYIHSYLIGHWYGLTIAITDQRGPKFDTPRYRSCAAYLSFNDRGRLKSYRFDNDESAFPDPPEWLFVRRSDVKEWIVNQPTESAAVR